MRGRLPEPWLGSVAACLMLAVAAAPPALACACCTDPGQRLVETVEIDAYAAGLLAEVAFTGQARLVTGPRGPEEVEGMTTASDVWRLTLTRETKRWLFAFDDGKGNTGGLTFELPARVTKFEVDPHDAEAPEPPSGPVLYKEWRLTAKASGTGLLAGSVGGDQQATLILHGRGNSCTDASQFTAWSIVLFGSKATNTLFGGLRAP